MATRTNRNNDEDDTEYLEQLQHVLEDLLIYVARQKQAKASRVAGGIREPGIAQTQWLSRPEAKSRVAEAQQAIQWANVRASTHREHQHQIKNICKRTGDALVAEGEILVALNLCYVEVFVSQDALKTWDTAWIDTPDTDNSSNEYLVDSVLQISHAQKDILETDPNKRGMQDVGLHLYAATMRSWIRCLYCMELEGHGLAALQRYPTKMKSVLLRTAASLAGVLQIILIYPSEAREDLYWVHYDACQLLLQICRYLYRLEAFDASLLFAMWVYRSVDAMLPLCTIKYLKWRTQIVKLGVHSALRLGQQKTGINLLNEFSQVVQLLRKEYEMDPPIPKKVTKTLRDTVGEIRFLQFLCLSQQSAATALKKFIRWNPDTPTQTTALVSTLCFSRMHDPRPEPLDKLVFYTVNGLLPFCQLGVAALKDTFDGNMEFSFTNFESSRAAALLPIDLHTELASWLFHNRQTYPNFASVIVTLAMARLYHWKNTVNPNMSQRRFKNADLGSVIGGYVRKMEMLMCLLTLEDEDHQCIPYQLSVVFEVGACAALCGNAKATGISNEETPEAVDHSPLTGCIHELIKSMLSKPDRSNMEYQYLSVLCSEKLLVCCRKDADVIHSLCEKSCRTLWTHVRKSLSQELSIADQANWQHRIRHEKGLEQICFRLHLCLWFLNSSDGLLISQVGKVATFLHTKSGDHSKATQIARRTLDQFEQLLWTYHQGIPSNLDPPHNRRNYNSKAVCSSNYTGSLEEYLSMQNMSCDHPFITSENGDSKNGVWSYFLMSGYVCQDLKLINIDLIVNMFRAELLLNTSFNSVNIQVNDKRNFATVSNSRIKSLRAECGDNQQWHALLDISLSPFLRAETERKQAFEKAWDRICTAEKENHILAQEVTGNNRSLTPRLLHRSGNGMLLGVETSSLERARGMYVGLFGKRLGAGTNVVNTSMEFPEAGIPVFVGDVSSPCDLLESNVVQYGETKFLSFRASELERNETYNFAVGVAETQISFHRKQKSGNVSMAESSRGFMCANDLCCSGLKCYWYLEASRFGYGETYVEHAVKFLRPFFDVSSFAPSTSTTPSQIIRLDLEAVNCTPRSLLSLVARCLVSLFKQNRISPIYTLEQLLANSKREGRFSSKVDQGVRGDFSVLGRTYFSFLPVESVFEYCQIGAAQCLAIAAQLGYVAEDPHIAYSACLAAMELLQSYLSSSGLGMEPCIPVIMELLMISKSLCEMPGRSSSCHRLTHDLSVFLSVFIRNSGGRLLQYPRVRFDLDKCGFLPTFGHLFDNVKSQHGEDTSPWSCKQVFTSYPSKILNTFRQFVQPNIGALNSLCGTNRYLLTLLTESIPPKSLQSQTDEGVLLKMFAYIDALLEKLKSSDSLEYDTHKKDSCHGFIKELAVCLGGSEVTPSIPAKKSKGKKAAKDPTETTEGPNALEKLGVGLLEQFIHSPAACIAVIDALLLTLCRHQSLGYALVSLSCIVESLLTLAAPSTQVPIDCLRPIITSILRCSFWLYNVAVGLDGSCEVESLPQFPKLFACEEISQSLTNGEAGETFKVWIGRLLKCFRKSDRGGPKATEEHEVFERYYHSCTGVYTNLGEVVECLHFVYDDISLFKNRSSKFDSLVAHVEESCLELNLSAPELKSCPQWYLLQKSEIDIEVGWQNVMVLREKLTSDEIDMLSTLAALSLARAKLCLQSGHTSEERYVEAATALSDACIYSVLSFSWSNLAEAIKTCYSSLPNLRSNTYCLYRVSRCAAKLCEEGLTYKSTSLQDKRHQGQSIGSKKSECPVPLRGITYNDIFACVSLIRESCQYLPNSTALDLKESLSAGCIATYVTLYRFVHNMAVGSVGRWYNSAPSQDECFSAGGRSLPGLRNNQVQKSKLLVHNQLERWPFPWKDNDVVRRSYINRGSMDSLGRSILSLSVWRDPIVFELSSSLYAYMSQLYEEFVENQELRREVITHLRTYTEWCEQKISELAIDEYDMTYDLSEEDKSTLEAAERALSRFNELIDFMESQIERHQEVVKRCKAVKDPRNSDKSQGLKLLNAAERARGACDTTLAQGVDNQNGKDLKVTVSHVHTLKKLRSAGNEPNSYMGRIETVWENYFKAIEFLRYQQDTPNLVSALMESAEFALSRGSSSSVDSAVRFWRDALDACFSSTGVLESRNVFKFPMSSYFENCSSENSENLMQKLGPLGICWAGTICTLIGAFDKSISVSESLKFCRRACCLFRAVLMEYFGDAVELTSFGAASISSMGKRRFVDIFGTSRSLLSPNLVIFALQFLCHTLLSFDYQFIDEVVPVSILYMWLVEQLSNDETLEIDAELIRIKALFFQGHWNSALSWFAVLSKRCPKHNKTNSDTDMDAQATAREKSGHSREGSATFDTIIVGSDVRGEKKTEDEESAQIIASPNNPFKKGCLVTEQPQLLLHAWNLRMVMSLYIFLEQERTQSPGILSSDKIIDLISYLETLSTVISTAAENAEEDDAEEDTSMSEDFSLAVIHSLRNYRLLYTSGTDRLAEVYLCIGDSTNCLKVLQEVLEEHQKQSNQKDVSRTSSLNDYFVRKAHLSTGISLAQHGSITASTVWLNRTVDLSKSSGDTIAAAHALFAQGNVHSLRGDLPSATNSYSLAAMFCKENELSSLFAMCVMELWNISLRSHLCGYSVEWKHVVNNIEEAVGVLTDRCCQKGFLHTVNGGVGLAVVEDMSNCSPQISLLAEIMLIIAEVKMFGFQISLEANIVSLASFSLEILSELRYPNPVLLQKSWLYKLYGIRQRIVSGHEDAYIDHILEHTIHESLSVNYPADTNSIALRKGIITEICVLQQLKKQEYAFSTSSGLWAISLLDEAKRLRFNKDDSCDIGAIHFEKQCGVLPSVLDDVTVPPVCRAVTTGWLVRQGKCSWLPNSLSNLSTSRIKSIGEYMSKECSSNFVITWCCSIECLTWSGSDNSTVLLIMFRRDGEEFAVAQVNLLSEEIDLLRRLFVRRHWQIKQAERLKTFTGYLISSDIDLLDQTFAQGGDHSKVCDTLKELAAKVDPVDESQDLFAMTTCNNASSF